MPSLLRRIAKLPRLFRGCVLLLTAAPTAIGAIPTGRTQTFEVNAGPAEQTLKRFSDQAGVGLLVNTEILRGVRTNAVRGELAADTALEAMLTGTGLGATRDARSGAFVVRRTAVASPAAPGSTPASDPATPVTFSPPVRLESFEVTGSRLRGLLEGATAQPVITLGAADIDRLGAQSIGDVLRAIPQVSSFTTGQAATQNQRNALLNTLTGATTYQAGTTQIGTAAGLVSGTLRGAPAGATLLLIDGKRAPKNNQSRSGDGFDLNGIPLAAIERIEVLLDGASSIYGADAMGGVINVITKRSYRSGEVRLSYENTFDTDVGVRTASLSQGFAAGQFRGLVTASWEKSNELMLRDRDFTASFDRRPFGGLDYRSPSMPGGAGRVSRTGTIPLPGLTVTSVAIPAGTSGGGLTTTEYANAGAIADPFDAGMYSQFAAAYDRSALFAKFDYGIRPWLEVYASVRVGRNRNYQLTTPIQASGLSIPAGYPGNPFGIAVNLSKTFVDLVPVRESTNDSAGFGLGAIGRLPAGWRYDLSISLARSHTRVDADSGATISSVLFNAAVAAGKSPNLFYDGSRVTSPNPPGTIEALTTVTRDEEKDQTWSYSAQIDGPVHRLPAGSVALAVGVERREEYADFPLRLATDTTSALPGRNTVNAAFAEVNVPVFGGDFRRTLLQQLSVSGSYRFEDYGSGGASRNPRAGVAWRPDSWLLLRGSYGEGFKVPTLQQRGAPVTVTNSNTIATAANLDPQRGNTVNPIYPVTRGGRSDLLSEKSENTTAGLVVEIPGINGLSLSLDWFDNVYRDRVATLLFNQMALLYPERITRGSRLPNDPAGWAGVVTATDLRPINVGFSQTTGYDVGLRYDRRHAIGQVLLGLTGTRYTRNVFVPTPGGLPSPTVNTDSLPVQISGSAFLTRDSFGAGLLASYRAANRPSADRGVVPAAIRWDAQLNLDLAKTGWWRTREARTRRILGDTKLSLTVFNLFNQRPPFDDLFMPDNTVLDARLRRYGISLRRAF